MKRIVHVLAIFCAGIITGGQYTVSLDYYPAGVSAAFYVEKIQYAIHHGGYALFGMLIAASVLCFLSALLYFSSNRKTSMLLFGATAFFVTGALITKFGNIPLLDLMDTWSAQSPPANWLEIAQRWYMFHSVRFGVDIIAFFLAIGSAYTSLRRQD